MRTSRHPRLRRVFIWLMGFVLAVVGFILFFRHELNPGHLVPRTHDFQVVTQANGSTVVQIKPSALPQSDTARASAPPNYLLPSHWASDPQVTYVGSDPNVREVGVVGAATEKQLVAATDTFLTNWESFYPLDNASYARYRATLAPLVDPGSLDNIAQRVDSHQPPVICAEPICTVGSRWMPIPAASALLTIRSADATSAYVTRYGAVRYHAPGQALDGETFAREYALLLDRINGHWLVERAVADTVGQEG